MIPGTKKWKRRYMRMFPGTKSGTRAHSPKPPFYETALLLSSRFFAEKISEKHGAHPSVTFEVSIRASNFMLEEGKRPPPPHLENNAFYQTPMWSSLGTPGGFTTRPLLVYVTTKLLFVRRFCVLGKDEMYMCGHGGLFASSNSACQGVPSKLLEVI